jgi:D-arabinose 1-dehydrogenase-like Zn-dependent alcohol dehydrogenase
VLGDVEGAQRLGADEVIDTTAAMQSTHASHPNGVDALLDLVDGSSTIGRDAQILSPGASRASTLYAADEGWFAKRDITATNISSFKHPLSSPQGLTQVAGMVGDGSVTVRVTSTTGLEGAGELLRRLRKGGLRGKAVVRL